MTEPWKTRLLGGSMGALAVICLHVADNILGWPWWGCLLAMLFGALLPVFGWALYEAIGFLLVARAMRNGNEGRWWQ